MNNAKHNILKDDNNNVLSISLRIVLLFELKSIKIHASLTQNIFNACLYFFQYFIDQYYLIIFLLIPQNINWIFCLFKKVLFPEISNPRFTYRTTYTLMESNYRFHVMFYETKTEKKTIKVPQPNPPLYINFYTKKKFNVFEIRI